MAKVSKQQLVEKLQLILTRLDRCSKKSYRNPYKVSEDFEAIGDRVADLLDRIISQRTPIY